MRQQKPGPSQARERAAETSPKEQRDAIDRKRQCSLRVPPFSRCSSSRPRGRAHRTIPVSPVTNTRFVVSRRIAVTRRNQDTSAVTHRTDTLGPSASINQATNDPYLQLPVELWRFGL